MDIGLGIGGSPGEAGALAARAEEAGFESCWAAETTNTAFVAAAAAISATSRIRVGTAVALAFPRSPTITAMTAFDLDELSRGRFLVGLGSQVKAVAERRFSVPFDHPAPRLREYVEAMRTVWAANRGEEVVHEGRFYTITMPGFHAAPQPGRRNVPVYLAAVNRIMARVCGEVADGLIGHPLASPRYLAEVVRPAVAEGAERTGRAPSDVNLTASVIASVADDPDVARREAKLQIAFYATTRTYRRILELHGRAHLVPELRAAFDAGDNDRLTALVDDELCDAIAATGSADEVVERVRAWEPVADRVIVSGPWFGVGPARSAANHDALIEAFGRVLRDQVGHHG
ncbi:LLM class flavin-dependent oxidoreductase [soil metagenome]